MAGSYASGCPESPDSPVFVRYTALMPAEGIIGRIRERLAIRRLYGPARPPRGVRCVLLCRVENGAEYAADFLRHYRMLGVQHFVFLDTGSTDGTPELLTGEDVTVFRTSLPFKTHRLRMRRWLMERCAPGTWTLNVDIDELFDYPSSACRPLGALLDYLDAGNFTAMRAHMLEMFASGPVGTADARRDAPLAERYPWYDLTAVAPIPSPSPFDPEPAYRGGIRAAVFGSEHFWLTKHPLIKAGSGAEAFTENEHSVKNCRLADVTGALLHFKFTERFPLYVREAVERAHHWNGSAEYALYAAALARDPALCLKRESARRWSGADALVAEGFLEESGAWRQAV